MNLTLLWPFAANDRLYSLDKVFVIIYTWHDRGREDDCRKKCCNSSLVPSACSARYLCQGLWLAPKSEHLRLLSRLPSAGNVPPSNGRIRDQSASDKAGERGRAKGIEYAMSPTKPKQYPSNISQAWLIILSSSRDLSKAMLDSSRGNVLITWQYTWQKSGLQCGHIGARRFNRFGNSALTLIREHG